MTTPKRPFGVTLLLWLVLILTAWGATRFVAAVRWWDVLYEFGARPSPLILAATGAAWAAAGGVLYMGIRRRKPWVRSAVPSSALVWLFEFWIERATSESPGSNLSFAFTLSGLLIGVIIVTMIHGSTRYYLTRSEEHEQPDQHSKTA